LHKLQHYLVGASSSFRWIRDRVWTPFCVIN